MTYKTYEGVTHGGAVTDAQLGRRRHEVHPRAPPLMAREWEEANGLQRALRRFAASGPGSWLFARILDRLDRLTFRLTTGQAHVLERAQRAAGRDGHHHRRAQRGSRARCRCWRCRPTDGMALVGSNYGRPKHPAWRHNLRANPDGEIDVEGERWRFRAEEVEDERRERIWQEALRTYPGFSAYAKRAAPRRISVFVLHRA